MSHKVTDAGRRRRRAAGLRTGPDQDVFTTNQITSALAAYRSAPTRTRQRPQASQPRCSATTPSRKWTVSLPTSSEAALALQIAVRFPDNGGADEVAIGPHGRLVKLDGSSQQRLQRGTSDGVARASRPGWTRWKPGGPAGAKEPLRNMADAADKRPQHL